MRIRAYWEAIAAVVLAAFIAMIVVWTGASKDFGSCFMGICLFFLIACACRVNWIEFFNKINGN